MNYLFISSVALSTSILFALLIAYRYAIIYREFLILAAVTAILVLYTIFSLILSSGDTSIPCAIVFLGTLIIIVAYIPVAIGLQRLLSAVPSLLLNIVDSEIVNGVVLFGTIIASLIISLISSFIGMMNW